MSPARSEARCAPPKPAQRRAAKKYRKNRGKLSSKPGSDYGDRGSFGRSAILRMKDFKYSSTLAR